MITRAWIGPELEGYCKGAITLFIEASIFTWTEIYSIISKHKFTRLYLGAGGKNIIGIYNFMNLKQYCDIYNIQIVLETTVDNLANLTDEIKENVELILTFRDKNISVENVDFIKLENNQGLHIYPTNNNYYTSISTLNKGMYSEVRLVYSGEEK